MQTTVSEPDGGVQILDRHEKCRLGGHAKIISGCINCLQTKLKYRVTRGSDVAHALGCKMLPAKSSTCSKPHQPKNWWVLRTAEDAQERKT